MLLETPANAYINGEVQTAIFLMIFWVFLLGLIKLQFMKIGEVAQQLCKLQMISQKH